MTTQENVTSRACDCSAVLRGEINSIAVKWSHCESGRRRFPRIIFLFNTYRFMMQLTNPDPVFDRRRRHSTEGNISPVEFERRFASSGICPAKRVKPNQRILK
ncbi:MAG: hypothetical protein ABIS45_01580 [Burkholderiales bacterium]